VSEGAIALGGNHAPPSRLAQASGVNAFKAVDKAPGMGINGAMRMRISHLTTYRYATPAASVVQMLRLTPRNHDGQYVARWRIDVSADCRLDQHEDAFGNITHAFTAEGPFEELKVMVEGEIETRDTQGIVRGAVERFPPSLYLRETALTGVDDAIAGFAAAAREAAGADVLKLLHLLLERLNGEMAIEPDSAPLDATTAAQAFAKKRGVSADLTHVFIAAARSVGIPARYVRGYVHQPEGASSAHAGHAWAEAFVGGLGWIAFDAANCICATDAHVRVAVGLDQLGAAPARGTRYGGTEETLAVDVQVEQAGRQGQN
jgi:transglutaminase-like putative cysteine protease